MTRFWRTLAAAAALSMMTAAVASAQMVLLRHATPGEAVEVVLNAKTVGTGTIGTDGVAKVPFALPADTLRTGMDARIYTDACANLRRVHIVERNAIVPPAQEGCARSEISGLYLVRRESTLVISVGATIPTLLLVKGDFSLKPPSPAPKAPRGLVIYGGGGLGSFPDFGTVQCGNAADCSSDDSVGLYTVGASYWITNWLAADGSFVKPSKPIAKGGAEGETFTSDSDIRFFTAGGRIGIPIHRVRLYGMGGATFHHATSTIVQTIGTASQTIVVKTDGTGWYAGGGMEVWASKRVALYGEVSRNVLKGKRTDKTEGPFDEPMSAGVLGVRIRIF